MDNFGINFLIKLIVLRNQKKNFSIVSEIFDLRVLKVARPVIEIDRKIELNASSN